MTSFPISPGAVRYIKLGPGGVWEKKCREDGVLRFGFDTGAQSSIDLCRQGRWDELAISWQQVRKSKGRATTDVNEIKAFWTDKGDTLWITFIGDDLCWGFLEPGEPVPYGSDPEEGSSFRRVSGGWQGVDKDNNRLSKSNLPGFITKIAGYRGTSCSVERSDLLVARINGIKTPDVERVVAAKAELQNSLAVLITSLGPQDFEILVDMMFSRAGWRRVGHVGRTTQDKDLDLEMPLTGEKAFVQIKTRAFTEDLNHYIERLDEMSAYQRLFFVYHTAEKDLRAAVDRKKVVVMDAKAVAEHVVEAGLVDWVVGRVY